MKEKDLRHRKRVELLDMLIEQGRLVDAQAEEINKLKAQIEELNQKLASLKEELFNLRFQLATGQLDNPMRIKDVKKTIARIKTIQREQAAKA